jgi:8-oxo-dGTP pyrophosphatase MutT (NUDIX family)
MASIRKEAKISDRSLGSAAAVTQATMPLGGFKSYDQLPLRHIVNIGQPLKASKSYGLIAYNTITEKWCIVQKRYTPSFITILEGRYVDTELDSLLNAVTIHEFDIIKSMVNEPTKVIEVHQRILGRCDQVEYCRRRFNSINIRALIQVKKPTLVGEWTFPSGQSAAKENTLTTAIREFSEETGIVLDGNSGLVLRVEIPEISKLPTREHVRIYYPFIMEVEDPFASQRIENPEGEPNPAKRQFDASEIAEVKWVTHNEAKQLLGIDRFTSLLKAQEEINKCLKLKDLDKIDVKNPEDHDFSDPDIPETDSPEETALPGDHIGHDEGYPAGGSEDIVDHKTKPSVIVPVTKLS